ncbi:TIR domain-containing protein [Sphingomonas sp. AOB5]|uniref:TIR domain-containing protein n=1 Tax=Sphingomonas sp. AOB5 TaxID=3034017 RepID=UPI0023F74315|nr:TIR domain-containing protein [Sphingomonas sp. AOB5]MDF7776491.1 TIR domain-containing protein [Sphingomonas sp. AOB5]
MAKLAERYDLVTPLSSGALFDAWRAIDTRTGETVFAKVARPALDGDAREMVAAHLVGWREFRAENPPGMPEILDLGEGDGRPFVVTRWLEGVPLNRLESTLPAHHVVRAIAIGALRALAGVHSRWMIHGDISPGNLIVQPDLSVHLVDPGARVPGVARGLTRRIHVTRAFAAPEVLAGKPATAASDLYALRMVLTGLAERLGIALHDVPWGPRSNAVDALGDVERMPRWPQPPPPPLPSDWRAERHEMMYSDLKPVDPKLLEMLRRLRPLQDRLASEARTETVAIPAAAPSPGDDDAWDARSMMVEVPMPAPPGDEPRKADFLVVAPRALAPGRNFFLELWIGPSNQRAAMTAEATRGGKMVERGGRSFVDLAADSIVTAILQLPDFEVEDRVERLGWNGTIRNAGFMARVPDALVPGLYPGRIKLLMDQTPFASIAFDLSVQGLKAMPEPESLDVRVQRIMKAFASYSSADRAEVLRRIQGMQATGVDVFLDIVGLRRGEMWEPALLREIDASDRLFLFWSRNAAASKWVDREWRYALERRGVDFIEPLALEDPRNVSPPDELAGKHFNDMLLTFIAAEEVHRGRA